MAERAAGIGHADVVALTILQVASVPAFFSAANPSMWTISWFADQDRDHTTTWIRKGELRASVYSLVTGVGVAMIARSPLPLLATAIAVAFHVWQTEDALAHGNGAGVMR